MSAICREDLLKDIEESVVCSGKVDHANAELRGVNKVIERIRIASAVYESHDGVYLSCGCSRPPEHGKFRFCPNCGTKL